MPGVANVRAIGVTGGGERSTGGRGRGERLGGDDPADDAVLVVVRVAPFAGLGGYVVPVSFGGGRRVDEGTDGDQRELRGREQQEGQAPGQRDPHSAPSSQAPQMANVAPGSFWMLTNRVRPSGLNVAPANSA